MAADRNGSLRRMPDGRYCLVPIVPFGVV